VAATARVSSPAPVDLLDPLRQSIVEILLGRTLVKGIESGLMHETAGNELGPEIHHRRQPTVLVTFDPQPRQTLFLPQLGEHHAVEQHIEMQHAICFCRDCPGRYGCIHHSSNRHSTGPTDSQNQSELVIRVDARDGEYDGIDPGNRPGIRALLNALPNLSEMGVDKVCMAQMAGKGPAQRLAVESVPESALHPLRPQAGSADRFRANQDSTAVEHREPRTPTLPAQTGTGREDSNIVQLDGNRDHVAHPGSIDGVAWTWR